MATLDLTAYRPAPAVVTRPQAQDTALGKYLLVTERGQPTWVDDPEAATAFASMREATRMATRLPSNLRAFSLPREPEITLRRLH